MTDWHTAVMDAMGTEGQFDQLSELENHTFGSVYEAACKYFPDMPRYHENENGLAAFLAKDAGGGFICGAVELDAHGWANFTTTTKTDDIDAAEKMFHVIYKNL